MANKKNRLELTDDKGILLRQALAGHQTTIWTALPAIVSKFTPGQMTCEVQPTIQAQLTDQYGAKTWKALPLLLDCPVMFPSAGGFALTFPINQGDEVLVIIASRCIDAWWQKGGVQQQSELRMHDLSDGFVIPGPRSLPNVLPNLSLTDVQLRNNAGTSFFSINASGALTATTPGAITVNAETAVFNTPGGTTINGPLQVNGTITTPDVVSAANFATPSVPDSNEHVHLSRTDGTALTGPPITGT
jgi:hypothetical protein